LTMISEEFVKHMHCLLSEIYSILGIARNEQPWGLLHACFRLDRRSKAHK